MARPEFGEIAGIALNPSSEKAGGVLACTVQSSIEDRQEVFLEEKIAEYKTVGMEMLRCTAGAGEITTPARI